MARNIKQIAKELGAEIVGTLPEAGGGAFGAARLPGLVAALRDQLQPGKGRRPGRPANPAWRRRAKVPMSDRTLRKLRSLAASASTPQRKVSPMQVAAQLLEEVVSHC
jgi:hypothetical protein